MNAERAFQDLGIDAVTGVELMDQLQISVDELQSPRRFSMLKEVINYFKNYSPDAQRFLISKATNGKMVDKLDHVFAYTKLLESKARYETELTQAEKEREAVTGDEILSQNAALKELELRKKVEFVKEEISIFEK